MCAHLQSETEEALRIDSLRHEIEDVENDIEKKIHYTRQLEHILLRLKKNQVCENGRPISILRDDLIMSLLLILFS